MGSLPSSPAAMAGIAAPARTAVIIQAERRPIVSSDPSLHRITTPLHAGHIGALVGVVGLLRSLLRLAVLPVLAHPTEQGPRGSADGGTLARITGDRPAHGTKRGS